LALKSANAPAAASAEGMVEASRALGGDAFARRYGIPGSANAATPTAPSDAKGRLVEFSQQGQFIAGKNFYQNNTQWVDAAAQKLQNAKKQRLQFNSTEYFAFAAKNPKALPWLALGQSVQFVMGDTLIEVYE